MPADYDGNDSTDMAIVRLSNGKWYIQGGSTVWHYLPGNFPLPVRDINADGDEYYRVYIDHYLKDDKESPRLYFKDLWLFVYFESKIL